MDPKNYDRISINEDDGQKFYGYDDDDGTTTWFTENGSADSITRTPSDEDGW